MGKVIQFRKKEKELPRGPGGKILLRKGQVWCRVHDAREVVVRELRKEGDKGKFRVYFSNKRTRRQSWEDLAEATFRSNYMEKSIFIPFSNEVLRKFRAEAESLGAGDGLYRLFDLPTADELARGLMQVEKPRKQPMPKRGELWKSNRAGRNGPLIFLVERISRSPFGGLMVTFRMHGGFGVGPSEDFRESRTRIGWLGEAPHEGRKV